MHPGPGVAGVVAKPAFGGGQGPGAGVPGVAEVGMEGLAGHTGLFGGGHAEVGADHWSNSP